jgi:hypothetical protein
VAQNRCVNTLLVVSIVVISMVVLGLVALAGVRRPASAPPEVPTVSVERRAVVVLDVEHSSSTSPAGQRLLHETAARVFAALPDCEEVEVRARDGSVVGRSARVVPEPRVISLPQFLSEPHSPRHHGPDLSGHLGEDEPFRPPPREGPFELTTLVSRVTPSREPRRPIVERFDLLPAIRGLVRNPDDLVDILRAILEAGGLAVDVDDDLLRADGLAIAVVRHIGGDTHEALNHAYRRIAASGAERGLVVALGCVEVVEVRRRELLAPQVLHTGFAGVQRMADAVALGADPIRFAVSPALAEAVAARL